MREIGFDHQHCTFHLLLNINEELREELKQIRKEYESNLKKQNVVVREAIEVCVDQVIPVGVVLKV